VLVRLRFTVLQTQGNQLLSLYPYLRSSDGGHEGRDECWGKHKLVKTKADQGSCGKGTQDRSAPSCEDPIGLLMLLVANRDGSYGVGVLYVVSYLSRI